MLLSAPSAKSRHQQPVRRPYLALSASALGIHARQVLSHLIGQKRRWSPLVTDTCPVWLQKPWPHWASCCPLCPAPQTMLPVVALACSSSTSEPCACVPLGVVVLMGPGGGAGRPASWHEWELASRSGGGGEWHVAMGRQQGSLTRHVQVQAGTALQGPALQGGRQTYLPRQGPSECLHSLCLIEFALFLRRKLFLLYFF